MDRGATPAQPRTQTALDLNRAAAILAGAAAAGRTTLLEPEVYGLLSAAGVAVPLHRLVLEAEEVDDALCAALGADEVVVKVVSPDLPHKSDVGGVATCANQPGAVRRAVAQVLAAARRARPDAHLVGALVAERVSYAAGLGRELLAGFRHDPAFGPVVVLGVGGLDTEALIGALRVEKARALLPAAGLTAAIAASAARGTLAHAALTGALRSSRGRGVPEERLAELALALGRLAEALAGFEPPHGLGLAELELNPVVVAEDGRLVAVDGLARLQRPEPLPPARPIERLAELLTPRSAVVIGASAEGSNPGRVILKNLVEGGGVPRNRLFALHPKAHEIEGCRAFASVAELPEPVDLAVVAVSAERAEGVLGELIATGRARSVTLIPGGFAETEAGRGVEQRIRARLAESHRAAGGGVLLNGGNCLGIISEPGGYNTFFIPEHKLPLRWAPGRNVASVSQSGAYLVSQISNLEGVVRPRYAISFGNQMDLTVSDYLAYLERDPEARVFAVYLEGFQRGDGARFLEAARRLKAAGRVVLLYKAGRTPEGSSAASSHTAAAVGDYDVCADLARQAGVVVCPTLDAFEDATLAFALLAGRTAAGRRVAVLSNAGYECTAAADALGRLELAALSPSTQERLRALLPPGIIDVHNPVDATPITPTDRYAACAQALLDDPGVDALVLAGVPATPALQSLPRGTGHQEDALGVGGMVERLTHVFQASGKPIVLSVDSGPLYDPLAHGLRRAGLPCFRKVDRAVRALGAFVAGAF